MKRRLVIAKKNRRKQRAMLFKKYVPGYEKHRKADQRAKLKAAALAKANKNQPSMYSFVTRTTTTSTAPTSSSESSSSSSSDSDEDAENKGAPLQETTVTDTVDLEHILDLLETEKAKIKGTTNHDTAKFTMCMALAAFVRLLQLGKTKYQSARVVAGMFFGKSGKHRVNARAAYQSAAEDGDADDEQQQLGGGGKRLKVKLQNQQRSYRRGAEKIRGAYEHFVREQQISGEQRGRASGVSLIFDEDVKILMKGVVGGLGKRFSASDFKHAASKVLEAKGLLYNGSKGIGNSTACMWLKELYTRRSGR